MRFASVLLIAAALSWAEDAPVKQLSFLVGSYGAGEQTTELGKPEGACSFSFDTGGTTLVRRNKVAYTGGKTPTPTHEDLLIFYSEGSELRAIYFDNENHTIRYKVTVPSTDTVTMESDAGAPGPRYRLTQSVKGNRLETKFEMAMPGQPYKMYVSGSADRK